MPKNNPDSYHNKPKSDLITSIIDEFSNPELEEEEFKNDFFLGFEGRRKKAALALSLIWLITITLHLIPMGWLVVMLLAIFILVQALRLLFSSPLTISSSVEVKPNKINTLPKISLLVAAKNEAPVISKLVAMLSELDYPQELYEFWVINDNSNDRTGEILDKLTQKYPQLNVLHRDSQARGGKSGALNQVLALTNGDLIGVFDADAIVSQDLLLQVVPLFATENIGAIQVRKAISNQNENFWTKGQSAEMALDSYFQQQRISCGGIGELRGNGQFVRRQALESCGGWNEETITDDLDLTIRLHLDDWDIGILPAPAVEEEGVKGAIALWHQRSRWAEGGYQRYLDYWRFILGTSLNWRKKFDLFYFFLIQYLLPTASIPDLLMVIIKHDLPLVAPLTTITVSVGFWGMFSGLKRSSNSKQLSWFEQIKLLSQSLLGMIYMTHWLIVMPITTLRMSIRQKRLKWVKTVHEGSSEDNLELA